MDKGAFWSGYLQLRGKAAKVLTYQCPGPAFMGVADGNGNYGQCGTEATRDGSGNNLFAD